MYHGSTIYVEDRNQVNNWKGEKIISKFGSKFDEFGLEKYVVD